MQALKLTHENVKAIFPKAPAAVVDAFVAKQQILADAGVTATRPRFADFCANIEHECDGFNVNGFVKNLTENIEAYSHGRMAQVWPGRFPGGGAQVAARFGTAPRWQYRAFDVIYGNRMGNGGPETHDGSKYIGRGGPQWTGKDGYRVVQELTGLPALAQPEVVCQLDKQPEVCTAFWRWKRMNRYSDTGNWIGLVKSWNGGTNGLADRNARKVGNADVIRRMQILDVVKTMPGGPAVPNQPPKPVVDEATATERKTRAGGVATAGAGGANELTGAVEAPKAVPSIAMSVVNYTLIGAGVCIILIATFLIVRKVKLVRENWF